METLKTTSDGAVLPTLNSSNQTGSEAVAWCFIPVGETQIGRYSPAFRDFFGLDDRLAHQAHEHGTTGAEDRLCETQPPQELRSNSNLQVYLSEQSVSTNGIRVTTEAVMDEDGRPAGRVLFFEKSTQPTLHEQTVERLQEAARRLDVLSPRESQIVDLVYQGLTNKAIGIQSAISEKTVEKHRSNIMQKLELRNSSQLIRIVNDARLGAELSRTAGPSSH